MMRKCLLSASLALLLAAPAGLSAAQAQTPNPQDPQSAAVKGRVTPLSVQVTQAGLPQAQVKSLTAKVSAIIDQVLQTPPLRDPHGFSLTRSLKVDAPLPGFDWHPSRAEVVMIAQEIDLSANPKPDASGAYMGRLEGPSFRIGVNNLMALYANIGSEPDAAGGFLTLPLVQTSQQGYPVFRVGMRDVILITKPGRLPYTAVSQAEYLQFLVNEEEALHAQFGPPTSPKAKAYYDRLLAARASLTEDAGKAPACVSSRLGVFLGDCNASDAVPYVKVNTSYFERGLAQGSVQLVTISTPAEGGFGHPRLEPKFREAGAALDLNAIRARLD